MGNTNLLAARPAILSIAKLVTVGLTKLPLAHAAPFALASIHTAVEETPIPSSDPTLWIYLAVAVSLVLLGGVFAGLTIALMGQDDVNLQVIHASGEGSEKKHAGKVLRLLKRGKHWVLVTLLLGNVITNETLPIVLDRSLGGGWPAVLGSTVLIVIFGEIIPQSICVRYGLPIGAWMSPLVLVLMYILAPAAWPTAKLLDYLLGEEHGTTYKKAGLKTLVDLHKTLGTNPNERLNQDEVTIISAVLDLKDKSVGSIMTPMEDVFTMSEEDILDEKTMHTILSQGYSRIPIHSKDNEEDFVGMLLVKILITYDPEDCKRVGDFALATLPETKPDASCLDIVNYFQEGKSHMVLISDEPGEDYGALGVVTLEDVIEELIGEEIIDESDVFIDVHKAIRRLTPAQQTRLPVRRSKAEAQAQKESLQNDLVDATHDSEQPDGFFSDVTFTDGEQPQAENKAQAKSKASLVDYGTSPKTTFLVRRSSSLVNTLNNGESNYPVLVRGNAPDLREHLKHLGPSNLASRPKQTRYNTVKIKQSATGGGGNGGAGGFVAAATGNSPEDSSKLRSSKTMPAPERSQSFALARPAARGGVGEGLLTDAGRDAKDGVQVLQAGYGSINQTVTSPLQQQENASPPSSATMVSEGVQANAESTIAEGDRLGVPSQSKGQSPSGGRRARSDSQNSEHSTLGPLHNGSRSPLAHSRRTSGSTSPNATRGKARSGSITENVVEAGGGVRKVILETTSSSSSLSDNDERAGGVAEGSGGRVGSGGVDLRRPQALDRSEISGSHQNAGPSYNDEDGDDGNGEGSHSRAGSNAGGAGGVDEASAAAKKKRRRKRKKAGAAGTDDRADGEDAPLLPR